MIVRCYNHDSADKRYVHVFIWFVFPPSDLNWKFVFKHEDELEHPRITCNHLTPHRLSANSQCFSQTHTTYCKETVPFSKEVNAAEFGERYTQLNKGT